MMSFAVCGEKAKDSFIHGTNVSEPRHWREASFP